jgi:hypothetical protein
MRRHLAALQANEMALKVYVELGKRSIKLASEQGANAEKLGQMRLDLEKRES